MKRFSPAAFVLFLVIGCAAPPEQTSEAPTTDPPDTTSMTSPPPPAAFVNRVWKVAESTGMSPGQLVVFLSDSTLVIASENARPALGRWSYDGTTLTMIEEGIAYPNEILSWKADELRLRGSNPGGGVIETRFVSGALGN